MNRDIAEARWKQLKGKVREHWGRLTEDDIDRIEGRHERLVGHVQEKYGRAKDEATREVNDFLERQSMSDRTR
jgi:uncharacterized protein YjbJ (UPF0337 family)